MSEIISIVFPCLPYFKAACPLGSSILLQMTGFPSFYGWIAFHCIYITLALSINLWTDRHLSCSVSWVSPIMLQWTWGYRYHFEIIILFPGVELLERMVVLFFVSWGTSKLFSIEAAPIYIPTSSAQGVSCLHIPVSICYLLSSLWQPS